VRDEQEYLEGERDIACSSYEKTQDCECACWRLAIREGHSACEVRVSRADWRSEQASMNRAEGTCHRAMLSKANGDL
jgi:hypothetical protein